MTTTTLSISTGTHAYLAPVSNLIRRKRKWLGYRKFMDSHKRRDSEFDKPGPFQDGARGRRYITRRTMVGKL